MGRKPAQVTVFISLIMMCLFAVFFVLVESARTAGARWYLQMAANSALDSVFSQYHRELWDSYRLLFAEYEDEEELTADFSAFLQPYLDTENWYPIACQNVQAEEILRVTDDQARYLEQEILDYMKYGIWRLDFEADMEEQLQECGQEAESITHVAEAYRGHTKEALKLERALEAVSENLAAEQEEKAQGLSRLRNFDGPGFRKEAAQLIRQLEKMPGLVETYRKRADALAAGLEKSRAACRPYRDECSEQVDDILEEEIREYESYVSLDGARRQEIEQLDPWSREQIRRVEEVIEEAKEVEEIIDEWEDEEDEEDDGPDLDALWRPVIRHFQQIEIKQLSFSHGVKDKEKEGWLKQIEQMYRSGLLTMLLPEGCQVSDRKANLAEIPSKMENGAEDSRGTRLTAHLMINEYCGEFFRCFADGYGTGNDTARQADGAEDESADADGRQETHVLDYELEYLIGGKITDEENLSAAVHRLLAIREGLNLVHILSDAPKRAEARNLALAITGLAGVTPLVLVTVFFIISVWALGEALADIRGLLAGRKVPFIKTAEDWYLSLDQLLEAGSNREVGTGGGEQGLSYESWLKVILFLDDPVRQEYRMMDVMQMNICLEQPGFRMRRGVYQVKLNGEFCGKHVFFSPVFVENVTGRRDHIYPMTVRTERVY